jgi:hypothetical protein
MIENCPHCGAQPTLSRCEWTRDHLAICNPCQWPTKSVDTDYERGIAEGEVYAIIQPTRAAAVEEWNEHCKESAS